MVKTSPLTFYRNSICFMCFWFGFEILRLLYKKTFFLNIVWFLSFIWPLILRWFQKCAEVLNLAKGKIFCKETLIFQAIKRFSEKKSSGTSWRKRSTHFWNQRKIPNSVSFDTLCAQFWRNFSTLIREGAIFLAVKRSNKMETVQYFKKRFL